MRPVLARFRRCNCREREQQEGRYCNKTGSPVRLQNRLLRLRAGGECRERYRLHWAHLRRSRGNLRANSARGARVGRNRLAEAVKANRQLGARELIAAVQKEVIDWTEGLGATDDITFFVIKALEETGPQPQTVTVAK